MPATETAMRIYNTYTDCLNVTPRLEHLFISGEWDTMTAEQQDAELSRARQEVDLSNQQESSNWRSLRKLRGLP